MKNEPFKTNQDFKSEAIRILSTRFIKESAILFVIGIIVSVITRITSIIIGILSIPFIGRFITPGLSFILVAVISSPLFFAYVRRLMYLTQGVDKSPKDIFHFYKGEDLPDTFLLSFMVNIQVLLFSLLLVVPGIITFCRYALYQHIKVDYPNLSPEEIMDMSSNMMDGHKMEYLILNLSFIGWYILASITVVGMIPFIIYREMTIVKFYQHLKEVNGEINAL